jgi:hypothetical protein
MISPQLMSPASDGDHSAEYHFPDAGNMVTGMTPERKKQILQIITGLGGLLAALGTLPIDSGSLPFPAEWRPYIISVGFFAVTARQWLQFIADMIDNGSVDGSYQINPKDYEP